jgi:hypothetical protein
MTRSCSTCEFSAVTRDADRFECRRRAPPAVVYFADTSGFAAWPKVKSSDWCGEHEAASQTKRRAA